RRKLVKSASQATVVLVLVLGGCGQPRIVTSTFHPNSDTGCPGGSPYLITEIPPVQAISGHVSGGGSSLAGAHVNLWRVTDEHLTSVLTDARGNFSFAGVATGTYWLVTCLSGFGTVRYEFIVQPSGVVDPLLIDLPLGM